MGASASADVGPQIGIRPRIVEAATEYRPIGVGINMLPHAMRELSELGLQDKLAARADHFAEFNRMLKASVTYALANRDEVFGALGEQAAQQGSEVDVVIEAGEYGPELKELVVVKQIQTPEIPVPAVNGSSTPF